MKDYEVSVLEQYDIELNSTRKIRGAVLCDTNRGWFLLKEATLSTKRIPMLCELHRTLQESGYANVDMLLPNKEGNFVTEIESGETYIVKRWFQGRECDIKKERETLGAGKNLAKLHLSMRDLFDIEDFVLLNLQNEYLRHNRELKKVRAFMRNKVRKGEFETAFLQCFEQMNDIAAQVYTRFSGSSYDVLYKDALLSRTIVHGEYNYHNILMVQNEIATTNFEHFYMDVQASDLYYYLRKIMEKQEWDVRLGDRILNAYSCVKPLRQEEMEYLALRLSYPEKFWKLANAYYCTNKAWIPAKNVEKLQKLIVQTQKKQRFLNDLFSFHL